MNITGTPLGDGITVTRIVQPTVLPQTSGFTNTSGDYDLVGDYLIDVDVRKTSLDMQIVTTTELLLDGVYD